MTGLRWKAASRVVQYNMLMTSPVISRESPLAADVQSLLERHLRFAHATTPSEHVHVLDVNGLLDPAISFFGARVDGVLVGVGALKHLDDGHAELKSMHTAAEARGRGIGRAMVDHIVAEARRRAYCRVSLETGSMRAFAPARALYARAGFVECGRFGDYPVSHTSTFMALELVD